MCVCGGGCGCGCGWVCVCVCEIFKILLIIFDEGKSHFLPFLVVYHILRETETWPFVRLLLVWIVQRCNISYIGILKRGLSRSSNKRELPWKMKRIWSKDWTKLALCRVLGTKCVTCSYIDKFAPFHNQMSVIHNIFVKFLQTIYFIKLKVQRR